MPELENQQPTTVIDLLEKIKRKVGDQECIFRGEPDYGFSKISSGLYRKLDEPDIVSMEDVTDEELKRFTEKLNERLTEYAEENGAQLPKKGDILKDVKKILSDIAGDEPVIEEFRKPVLQQLQRDYANGAKRRAGSVKPDVEILAEIQHYGGETNLIDFSESHLTALFFACYDDSYGKNDGRLVALPKQDIAEVPSGGLIPEGNRFIVRPLPDNRRALVQHSVMLHEPSGYLEYTDGRIISVSIPSGLKKEILSYLAEFCNISAETIFPDIPGYIESQKFTRISRLYQMRALVLLTEEKYEQARTYSEKALKLGVANAELYGINASANLGLQCYGKALESCNRAIKLGANNSVVYNLRANAHLGLKSYDEALSDSDHALILDNTNAMAYNTRGKVYFGRGMNVRPVNYKDLEERQKEFCKSKADFTKAVEIIGKLGQTKQYEQIKYGLDYTEVNLLMVRATIAKQQGEKEEAKELMTAALNLATKRKWDEQIEGIQQDLDAL